MWSRAINIASSLASEPLLVRYITWTGKHRAAHIHPASCPHWSKMKEAHKVPLGDLASRPLVSHSTHGELDRHRCLLYATVSSTASLQPLSLSCGPRCRQKNSNGCLNDFYQELDINVTQRRRKDLTGGSGPHWRSPHQQTNPDIASHPHPTATACIPGGWTLVSCSRSLSWSWGCNCVCGSPSCAPWTYPGQNQIWWTEATALDANLVSVFFLVNQIFTYYDKITL